MRKINGPKAYIDSSRLKTNILKIRKHIGKKKIMVVVKANGYGHGAINIASSLSNKTDIIFCVFSINEAIELRKAGVNNSILIFSKLQSDWVNLAVEYNLWINASSMNDLDILVEFYENNKSCPKIHLEFDTGMTRSGFDYFDDEKVFNYLSNYPLLPVQGIYSHFATADEGDLTYADYQLEKFKRILKNAKFSSIDLQYIHCSNSGSILNIPDSLFNTVRVGMLAYGVSPSKEVKMHINVEPVMSFCGPIVSTRKVNKNTLVSYGGVYKTKHSSNIAVIQTGFADGLSREWFKDGYISYKGNHYKIAGRICMDQFMVDFKDTTPGIGEEVLMFGKKGPDNIPIELIADNINTTTYNLLTAVRGRTEYIVQ